jgi:valyl-tRNA synthetase
MEECESDEFQSTWQRLWTPRRWTALADLEVEHAEHNGHLYYIRYPFAERSGGIAVATARPETMLGDTAVAINPDDERY